MSKRVEEKWEDPARLGPPINAHVDAGHLQQAQQRATGALGKARQALAEEQNGNHAFAIDLWRDVLGPDFPKP